MPLLGLSYPGIEHVSISQSVHRFAQLVRLRDLARRILEDPLKQHLMVDIRNVRRSPGSRNGRAVEHDSEHFED